MARDGISRQLHGRVADLWLAGGSVLAMGARWVWGDSLEHRQRRIGSRCDVCGTADHALVCRHRRGGVWAGSADDYFRLLSGSAPRAGAGVVLYRDPGGQRAGLSARRAVRSTRALAMGVLFGRSAGASVGRDLLLHAQAAGRPR